MARSMPSRASTSRSRRASASACSAPTARARRRLSRSWKASIARLPARSRSWAAQWSTDEVAIRERIGVTLQETRFPDKETVHEIVSLFRSFYKTGMNPEDVIARVSLESKSNAFIEQLSGGQQQRLAVAIALVGDPEILFLDEPTTGLDPQSRRQLWEVIRDLRDRGRTVVLTTHYMDEAERLCDRVAIIDNGNIIAQGSPAELIARLGGDHIVEFALEVGGTADVRTPIRFWASTRCSPLGSRMMDTL